jgi:hypothetical protein
LLGPDLIENLEVSWRLFLHRKDLRSELENLIEINREIRETREESERTRSTLGKTQSIFSEGRNASFLNQELMFLIENLHSKAAESGLR